MEYTVVERTAKQQGHNWFGHQISVYVSQKKRPELEAFLLERIGAKGKTWRLPPTRAFSIFQRADTIIRFVKKSHAMLFKLAWEEEEYEDYYKSFMTKLAMNSSFGKLSQMAPLYSPTVLGPSTPGIHPTSTGKTYTRPPVSQSTSRSNRYSLNPCQEIVLMDYESTGVLPWYDHHVSNMECSSWKDYGHILESMIRDESYDKTNAAMRSLAKEFATSFDISKIRS